MAEEAIILSRVMKTGDNPKPMGIGTEIRTGEDRDYNSISRDQGNMY